MSIRFRRSGSDGDRSATWPAILSAVVVGVLVALVCLAPWRGEEAPLSAEPAALWEAHLERAGVPGGGFAVVTSRGTRERVVRGVDGAGQPWSEQTPALWGSVSKPVAAAVARRLASEGDLDLAAPITTHLTWPDCPAASRVTGMDLIHHTSGVGGATRSLDRAGAATATDRFTRTADDLCPRREQGRYDYSSANYLLLAALLEAATGSSFTDLVTRVVTAPIGTQGLVTTPEVAGAGPPGHRYVAALPIPMRTPYDGGGVAYGYLGGTLRDLERVAAGFLGDDPVLGSPLADPGVATGSADRYGSGWRLRPLPDGSTMAWHSGMVPGFTTTIMLWPRQDLALVTVQNTSGPWHAASLLAGPTALADVVVATGAQVEPEQRVDPLYPLTSGLLATLAVLLGWWLCRRRRAPRRSAAIAAAILAAGIAAGVTAAAGSGMARQAFLWVPDVATLASLTAALAFAVAMRAVVHRVPGGSAPRRSRGPRR